ncbi:hypothetical protein BFG57_02995 [Bacillus solimangrovi]|uniref:Tetratricopeptide repeat protein n=2 Tax=Bacillus solimangrovi TaxID=1305675 RepID=A0A1E5LDT1_9BACI|nr:hypothetical protein BFG57_02995 [Bacillus solimangrovi]
MRTGLSFEKKQGKVLPFIQDGEHFFKKGIKAYRQGDLKKAEHHLTRAVRMDKEEPIFLCQLAVVVSELGNYQESNEMLEKVLYELEPEMVDCYYFLANNYAYLGLFHEAKVKTEKYLSEAPEGEYVEDANELLKLLKFEDSLDGETDESLRAEESLIIRHDQAKKLIAEGKLSQAEQVLKQLTVDYPEFWSAYNNLAITYFQQGLTSEAIQITEEVLERSTGNLHALCNLAVFFHYLGDKTKTSHLQSQLESVYPIEMECRSKLGTTLVLLGSYSQGYKWLRSIYKRGFVGEASFYYWLSVGAYQLGDEKFAEQAWLEFIKKNPEKANEKPWKDTKQQSNGIEAHEYDDFYQVLYGTDSYGERFFALYALYQNADKVAITMVEEFVKSHDVDEQLKSFAITLLKQKGFNKQMMSTSESMEIGFETAQQLIKLINDEMHTDEIKRLYMLWFTAFANMIKENKTMMRNSKAWAAAVEYIWCGTTNDPKTQKVLAKQYDLSVSTISKYVKIVKNLID